ncbi:glycerophosphodiester phosphodiesterase [Sphingomonas sp. HF-S4]|uniref:glycerophosphodiester phosphodiesterase n=1 Tax=Sphingomonas agrestis TaxID=3080540 RepID=A0ABU3YC48_9SPHN|nr:glycerophosphodiester phosphodiesterase [Sphingomonas sp. HF-S4]MDV3458975.1 glycerophosphodiester phosphodiesterase [Sphingomonas sp. HF-S4]
MAARPIVIAHRGASGERPEHTLLAYSLAIEQGADFIEPDLVPTKDGELVARHENEISGTTDVAAHPEFAARKTTKTIDGAKVTGWFTEDFTLAELKTLRAKERLPQLRPGNTKYDGQAEIPTLEEIIALAKAAKRRVGIYPETKHPSYFASIGLPLEATLVAKLREAGWDHADAPVFIQSFEVANLKKLKGMTRVPLIQLMAASGAPADGTEPSDAAMATPEGLKRIADYAAGIGPERAMLPDTSLVADAHAAGLKVHPWTFRAENYFLLPAYRATGGPAGHGRLTEEIAYFIGLGVDGVFSDYPYAAVSARAASVPAPQPR